MKSTLVQYVFAEVSLSRGNVAKRLTYIFNISQMFKASKPASIYEEVNVCHIYIELRVGFALVPRLTFFAFEPVNQRFGKAVANNSPLFLSEVVLPGWPFVLFSRPSGECSVIIQQTENILRIQISDPVFCGSFGVWHPNTQF